MSEKPATIGERAVIKAYKIAEEMPDADELAALRRLRGPGLERSTALAAEIDAMVEARIAAIEASAKESKASELRAWAETGRANKAWTEAEAKLTEFHQWAFAQCDSECGPYRKAGLHAPNCPVADLKLESKGEA